MQPTLTALQWICQPFDSLTNKQVYDSINLRLTVFAFEQQVGYVDTDYRDLEAYHLLAYHGDQLVAYARLLPVGVAYEDACSIGRVCVAANARKISLGKELINKSIQHCEALFPTTSKIKIGAQYYLLPFYEKLGFAIAGDLYYEDALPHKKMQRKNDGICL